MDKYRVDAELVFEGDIQGGITLTFEAESAAEAIKMAEEVFKETLNECRADIFQVAVTEPDEEEE